MLRRQLNPWERLDDPSRRTVLSFVFKLALVVPLVMFARSPAAAVHTIALIYALWCTVLAILLRQRAYGPNLNYWDEVLWFFAVSAGSGIWTAHSHPAVE